MTRDQGREADAAGRQALINYYNRVKPPVKQSGRFWLGRLAAGLVLAGVLCATGNTFTGGGDTSTDDRGDDRSHEKEYNPDGAPKDTGGEGTVVGQPGASSVPESSLTCKLGSLTVLESGSNTHKFVLNLVVEGADVRDPNTQVVAPLVREGAFVPNQGGSVVLNPDGSRVAEVPGGSTAADVYGIYVSSGGAEAVCGGVYFDGPNDRYPGIADDDQLPPHS
jgi:hypothetical protein